MRPDDSVTGTRCTRCTPGLVLEPPVRIATAHLEDGVLEPAEVARRAREHVGLPAMPLGESPVHLVELACPQRRLLPAGSRSDLDDHVLAVVGVLGHEQRLRAEPGSRRHAASAFVGLVLEERDHLGIALERGELASIGRLLHRLAVLAVGRHDLLELRVRLAERAEPIGVRGDAGLGHLGGDARRDGPGSPRAGDRGRRSRCRSSQGVADRPTRVGRGTRAPARR